MSGYVRAHRALFGHHAFRNDAEGLAFLWMVAHASWKPTQVRYKDRDITLQRGQLAVSVRDFARRIDRDKAWVERLIRRLKAKTMIKTASETGVTLVTICNYDKFQALADTSETLNGTPHKTASETGVRQARDTEQGREEGKKSSVANATGAEAPSDDPVKMLFDVGVKLLTDAGHTVQQARSLIGKWRKGRKDSEVLAALIDCRTRAISEPVEWLTKRFQGGQYVSASGYEYRGTIEQVIRESEKRADWNTHWQAKRDLEGRTTQ